MTTTTSYAATSPASTTSTTASAASSVAATNSLTKLASNFNDFLSLLTTQLKNQDPTSPMDTNQFTSQLVQFTAVSEQISTNATLGQLLTSSLSQQLTQASNLVGKDVTFSGGTLPLQNGAAEVDFQSSGAQSVQITVSDVSGNTVQQQTVSATNGANVWKWDGTNASGKQLADGSYTVAVTGTGGTVPFQAVGTVTGAEQVNQAVQLQFGSSTVPFANVVSLTASAATSATAAN